MNESTIHGSIKVGIVFKNVQFNRDIRGERLARTRQCNNGGHCIVGTAGRGAITAWTMAAPSRVPSSVAGHALLSLSLPRRDSLIKKETIFQFSIRFTVSRSPLLPPLLIALVGQK